MTTLAKTRQLNGKKERKQSEHCPSENQEFYILWDAQTCSERLRQLGVSGQGNASLNKTTDSFEMINISVHTNTLSTERTKTLRNSYLYSTFNVSNTHLFKTSRREGGRQTRKE